MTAGLFPDFLPGCAIDQIEQDEQGLILQAHVNGVLATCPVCEQNSMCVHSSYIRSPQDLPIANQAVRIRLRVRRFRCRNLVCVRKTFVERIPELLPAHAQRTTRLTQTLRHVGHAVGGEGGTRLLGQLQIATSARTLLRLLRLESESLTHAVRALGVDDWAMCRGRTYGTILVDLERHQPVDLLPDRTAATLTAWLQAHPQVEIIARDRSTEYARGASEGAPNALQVADRWHLLQNLRQMLERLLNRLYPQLRQLPSVDVIESPIATQIVQPRMRLRLDLKDKEAIAVSRARAQATYHEVQRLRKAGLGIRQIAHQLEMHRATVRKYFYAETFPERAKRQATPRMLDHYLPYLELRLQAGCDNATQLWRELREQGYTGSCVQVRRWMRQRREKVAPTTPGPYRDAVITAIAARTKQVECEELPSYKKLTWLLMRYPEELAPSEMDTLQRICQDSRVEHTHQLVQQFQAMVRHRDSSVFDTWLDACAASGIADFVTFAAGLRQDYNAVRAALNTSWSNGQTEGQVTRLKYLKRQMYGRANFDLLRLRVLHPN